jgi:hypothetical protein
MNPLYNVGTKLALQSPTSSYFDDSNCSTPTSESSGPYSEVYESTRKLTTSLLLHARQTPRKPHLAELDSLLDSHFSSLSRSKQSSHIPSPDSREITHRAAKNNVIYQREPLPLSQNVSFDGMVPYMSPSDQLVLLRKREKVLELERWKKVWSDVRPPVRGWYAMKGTGFNGEARRCRRLVGSEERQEMEASVRDSLMDMYRAASEDHWMTNRRKGVDSNGC